MPRLLIVHCLPPYHSPLLTLYLPFVILLFPIRFLGGVLGARFSSRLMLGGGLLLTALINITFGFFHSVTAFTMLWFLNGSLQVSGSVCMRLIS